MRQALASLCKTNSIQLTKKSDNGFCIHRKIIWKTGIHAEYVIYLKNCLFTDPSECTDCPVGHYCPSGSEAEPRTAAIPCDQGTYNPNTSSPSKLNCHQCKAGYACDGVGMSDYTLLCKMGKKFILLLN